MAFFVTVHCYCFSKFQIGWITYLYISSSTVHIPASKFILLFCLFASSILLFYILCIQKLCLLKMELRFRVAPQPVWSVRRKTSISLTTKCLYPHTHLVLILWSSTCRIQTWADVVPTYEILKINAWVSYTSELNVQIDIINSCVPVYLLVHLAFFAWGSKLSNVSVTVYAFSRKQLNYIAHVSIFPSITVTVHSARSRRVL